jgi:4-hydroxybenzoate polyprenyltransferase
MIAFLRLIRFPNLIIIALTQYLMRYAIIQPMLEVYGFELQLSHFHFFLLSLSTVFIAAAGYIINDYFDTKIDRINRPETVVVGVSIKRRVAMGGHLVLSTLGVFLGFYVGYEVGIFKLGIIHFIATGLLWFYSTDFKKQSFIGNLIVALLSAMVPMLVPIYEIPLLNMAHADIIIEAGENFNIIFLFIGGFALFAFLMTMVREVIKDIEDYKGDEAFGLKTIPIAYGLENAKKLALGFILLTILALGFIQYRQLDFGDRYSFFYLFLVIDIPLVYLAWRLKQANSPEEFHAASTLTKLIMLLGIGYSLLIYIILSNFDPFTEKIKRLIESL